MLYLFTKKYRVCEHCQMNSVILEFHELPEEEKYNFDWFEKEKHILLFCKECKIYKLLE